MIPGDIHGDPVSLLAFAPEDIWDGYIAWLNDPEVMRYTEARQRKTDAESARAYVETAREAPDFCLWRIFDGERHVGNLTLSSISDFHRRCEIALIVGDKSCWGQGVGAAAIRLATGYAFDTLGLRKVSGLIYEANTASVKSFEKAGYREECRLEQHFLSDGEPMDGIWMRKLAGEA